MAAPFAGRVAHPRSDGFLYGPGAARRELAGLVDRVGATRTFVVTTPSLTRLGLVDELLGWLGGRCVGSFGLSREHTPEPVVLEAAAAARAARADGLVSFGGSSAVDLTKGVALLLDGGTLADHRNGAASGVGAGRTVRAPRPGRVPHVAVPTTLSGAEFTAAAGITDPTTGAKHGYVDAGLLPRWVVLDSELAASCPARLWAGTGMKVVADALEALTSRRANPQTDALALAALRLLVDHLPAACADAADHEARGRCQFAVAMVFPQLATTGTGLVSALRHQLGGGLGIPHGEASTIVLPHVLRLNLGAPGVPAVYERAARELGLRRAEDLVERVESLVVALGLPTRLRDTGVSLAQVDDAAMIGRVVAEGGARHNAAAVDADAVRRVLAAAW